MLDIISNRQDSLRAIAYLDGLDARIFNRLTSRLGSEEKAQNAIILVGLLDELSRQKSKSSKVRIEKIHAYFLETLGVSYEELDRILTDV